MTPPLPRHRVIFDALRQQIAAGRFDAARRLPSEMELARRYGVSRPTAARALRDLQAQGVVERRVGSGTYVRAAGTTATDRPRLGLYAPGLGHTEILEPLCHEIVRQGLACGVALQWPNDESPHVTARQAEDACRRFIDRGVAGVFFAALEHVPQRELVNRRIVEVFDAAGVAVVLLDRDVLEFPARSRFDLVSIDHYQAAFVLADHLLDLGRRRFRFVARPGYPATTDLRMAGCREAIARRGVALAPDWARFGDPTDAAFVRGALSPLPDAIVCTNDLTAALLIQTLSRLDGQLQHDISIVGFDDVKYATLLSVPLTTIRQPCADLARVALDAMLARLQDPTLPARQILLKGDLIVRSSSRPGRRGAVAAAGSGRPAAAAGRSRARESRQTSGRRSPPPRCPSPSGA